MFETAVSKRTQFCVRIVCHFTQIFLHITTTNSRTTHTQPFTQFYESSSGDASEQKPNAPPPPKKNSPHKIKTKHVTEPSCQSNTFCYIRPAYGWRPAFVKAL